jgi:hypothetical protein
MKKTVLLLSILACITISYSNNIRIKADYKTIKKNKPFYSEGSITITDDKIECSPQFISLKREKITINISDIDHIDELNSNGKKIIIITKNNESIKIYALQDKFKLKQEIEARM